jgi:hypothetical protein
VFPLPGGYCSSRTCTVGQACDNGSGICVDPLGAGLFVLCLQVCQSPAECRPAEGYDCTTFPLGADPTTYCFPPSGLPTNDGGVVFGDGGFGLGDGGLPFP